MALHNPKVGFVSLGCPKAGSDSERILTQLRAEGYDISKSYQDADLVVVNTCGFIDSAVKESMDAIGEAVKKNGKVIVTGCLGAKKDIIEKEYPNLLAITGPHALNEVMSAVHTHLEKPHDPFSDLVPPQGIRLTPKHYAYLKISEGCNHRCSFCIIPFARGRSRAISVADAVKEAKGLIAQGFKEIVLTGVNIGEYEQASGEKLHDLVREVLALEGLERFRLSSVEPNTITDELLEVLKSSSKVMDHFHIPMQSGDDDILKSMRRKYTVSDYKRIIGNIMKAFPNAGIGADVIVGYPGESKEQFENTFNLLKELPITHFHVFPYSKRKNTTAAKMENHIHATEKKDRVKTLMMFGDAKLNLFSEDQIGKKTKVLFERRNKKGLFEGYSSNYVRVQVDTDLDLSNVEREVLITKMVDGKCVGELVN